MGIPTHPRVPSPTLMTLLTLPSEIIIEIFSYFIAVRKPGGNEEPDFAPLKVPIRKPVPKEEREAYLTFRSTCRRFRTIADHQVAFERYFPTDALLKLYKPITYYRYHDLCENLYAPRAAIQTLTIESIPTEDDRTVTENAMVRSMNARIISRLDSFESLQEVTVYCKPPGVEESSEYEWCANPLPTHSCGFNHTHAILNSLVKPASKLPNVTVLKLRALEPEHHDVFDSPEWAVLLEKLITFEIELEYKPPHPMYNMDDELYEDPKYPQDAFRPSNPELRLTAFAEQFAKWPTYLKQVRELKINVQEVQSEGTNRPTFRFNSFFHATKGEEGLIMPALKRIYLRRICIDRGLMEFFLAHTSISEVVLESSGPKHSRYGESGGLRWAEIYRDFLQMQELRAFEIRGSNKDEKRVAAADGEGWLHKLKKKVDKKSLQDDAEENENTSWLFLG